MAEEEKKHITNNTKSSKDSTFDKAIEGLPDTPNSAEIKNLTNISFEDISLVEKVGHGSYGVVYKALLNNNYVAVKEFGPAADQKVIETEIKQLSRVSHENIIALYGKASYQNFEYLIMEYAEGGSLHNFLHGQVKPYYSTAHAISWARQCAEGVAYLHAMQPKPMIHRDLKPLNLLLTDKGRNLKICDFGTVADKSTLMTNNRGSAAWMAPEVFEGNNYTEKCDIFSWSIVLWEVLSRQIPFKEIDNTYSIMWKIHKGVRPPLIKDCPEPIQNLMISCWATKPDDRPSMQHVAAAMRALALVFPGAEQPLDYEYVNQQILNSTDDFLENNISSLDFGDFHTVWRDTCTSLNSQTNNGINPLDISLIPPHLTEILQIPKPQESFRYGVIPEENESTCFNTENNNTTDYEHLLRSTTSNKRNDTIRNGMYQKADVPMSPLHVNVDWDSVDNEAGNYYVNNNYRDSLMLSDRPSSNLGTMLTEDDSLTQLLDADLQPVLPLPGNCQSEAIYRQHRQLGNEHLRVVTELVYAQDFKEKILLQMEPTERKQKEELLRKMGEKEELLELYNNLKQQLEKLRSESKDIHQTYGGQEHSSQPADTLNEEGWVVLSSPQNT